MTANLDPKESGPADGLLALAVSHLVADIAREEDEGAAMLQLLACLSLLEAEQLNRTASASLRLPAAGLYVLAGCPLAVKDQLDALGVKQIMHDTLSLHWLLPVLLGSGADPGTAQPLHR